MPSTVEAVAGVVPLLSQKKVVALSLVLVVEVLGQVRVARKTVVLVEHGTLTL